MTEEFPNNSSRAGQEVPPEVEKQIEKIIEGTATVRKPSGFRRFRQSFIAGDAHSVGEHVFWNLLIPSSKDAVSDMCRTFVDMMIYGEKRNYGPPGGYNPASMPGAATTKVNYGGISSGSRLIQPPGQPQYSGAPMSTDDIYVPTRAEAETVIRRMFDVLAKYHVVTIADLYGWIGVTPTPLDFKRGWTNLDGADVRREAVGVRLVLPVPEDLN